MTPMPINVNAVGKPSMIITTISASIIRPIWPVVNAPQGVRKAIIAMTMPIHAKPNHIALGNFIFAAPARQHSGLPARYPRL